MYETKGVRTKGYQVMVSVANPATAPVLVKYANFVANARDAELAITSVITVPYQTPLREAYRFIEAARDLLADTSKLADDHLTVQSILRYGHSFARGIISSVKEHRTDLLILGWSGNTRREHFAMGSTLDPVIEQAPCDLLVVKVAEQEPDKESRRILFPAKGQSPHGQLAAEVVSLLAKQFHAEVTLLHVRQQDASEPEPDSMPEAIATQLQGVKYSLKIVESDDVATSIVNESHNHDVVVIGATAENLFQQMLFGSIPEKIAKRCPKTVLMVKKDLGIHSWFRRWFA
jgi:nucleotide-binding universal stress UspA family protein